MSKNKLILDGEEIEIPKEFLNEIAEKVKNSKASKEEEMSKFLHDQFNGQKFRASNFDGRVSRGSGRTTPEAVPITERGSPTGDLCVRGPVTSEASHESNPATGSEAVQHVARDPNASNCKLGSGGRVTPESAPIARRGNPNGISFVRGRGHPKWF